MTSYTHDFELTAGGTHIVGELTFQEPGDVWTFDQAELNIDLGVDMRVNDLQRFGEYLYALCQLAAHLGPVVLCKVEKKA